MLAAVFLPWRVLFEQSKLDLLFYGIDAVDEHANLLSQAVASTRALANNFTRVLMKGVVVVGQRV